MTSTIKAKSRRGGAIFIGAGILLSRIAGLARERLFAHYFGNGDAADVFRAAFRIPNLLQNLFGEGVLSASFIPVYAGLKDSDPKEAARVAGVMASLLGLLTTVLVLLGVLATPLLISLVAPGFEGDKREAVITLVRILFPGLGFLVLSAFCLGVLNSHRRFFISYAAPVVWNGAMIVTLWVFRDSGGYVFAEYLAWGAVVGSLLQLLIQIPFLRPYLQGMRPGLETRSQPVREILQRFVPNLMARGVIQINAYVESSIASFLATGAVSAISYAQLLYTLPTSLFGTAVAASSLVEMSTENRREEIAIKIHQGMRHIAFFIIPSAIAFIVMGNVVIATVLKTGKFQDDDTLYVWVILATSAIGLLASTQSRLLATTFYALKDAKTPLRCSIARMITSTAGALVFSMALPRFMPMHQYVVTAGIPLATGIAAFLEYTLLRRSLRRQLSFEALPFRFIVKIAAAALLGGLAGSFSYQYLAAWSLPEFIRGLLSIALFGAIYAGLTIVLGIPEAQALWLKIRRRLPI